MLSPLSEDSRVEVDLWDPAKQFLLFVNSRDPSLDASSWAAEHRAPIVDALSRYGVVFLRGFRADAAEFERTIDQVAPNPLTYKGGVSPRSRIQGTVYTSTDAPPGIGIVQHHEMAYDTGYPKVVAFFADQAPEEAGETPVCDSRDIGRRLDPKMLDKLSELGVLYVRNYNPRSPLRSVAQTWGTDDRSVIEASLFAADTEWDWVEPDWLRTRQRRTAIFEDRLSQQRLLFACVHLWNERYFGPVARALGTQVPDAPIDQWNASFFGDGSEIPVGFIDEILDAYQAQQVAIPWQAGDIMIVNNLNATHGRNPGRGARRILATLREPNLASISPSPLREFQDAAHV